MNLNKSNSNKYIITPERILGVFITLLLLLMGYIYYYDSKDFNCLYAKELSRKTIAGVIKSKKTSAHNQNDLFINITMEDRIEYELVLVRYVHGDFYSYVQPGDTIQKAGNTLYFNVIKPGGYTRSFLLNFGCQDTLLLREISENQDVYRAK